MDGGLRKVWRKPASLARVSSGLPASVTATNCIPGLGGPVASTRARKKSYKARVSAVVPDLLETRNSVRGTLTWSSTRFTAAGSVESSIKRSGNPILEPKVRPNTSAQSEEPPTPRTTTWENCRRLTSSANALSSSTCARMMVGAVSQPRRLRMRSGSPFQSVASLVQSRSRKLCDSRNASVSSTRGSWSASGVLRS